MLTDFVYARVQVGAVHFVNDLPERTCVILCDDAIRKALGERSMIQ
jgi:hypothetical protein